MFPTVSSGKQSAACVKDSGSSFDSLCSNSGHGWVSGLIVIVVSRPGLTMITIEPVWRENWPRRCRHPLDTPWLARPITVKPETQQCAAAKQVFICFFLRFMWKFEVTQVRSGYIKLEGVWLHQPLPSTAEVVRLCSLYTQVEEEVLIQHLYSSTSDKVQDLKCPPSIKVKSFPPAKSNLNDPHIVVIQVKEGMSSFSVVIVCLCHQHTSFKVYLYTLIQTIIDNSLQTHQNWSNGPVCGTLWCHSDNDVHFSLFLYFWTSVKFLPVSYNVISMPQ